MPAKKPETGGVTPVFDARQQNIFKAGYSVNETCEILPFGPTKIYDLIREGRLKSVLLGKRRIVLGYSIAKLLIELEEEGLKFSQSPNPRAPRGAVTEPDTLTGGKSVTPPDLEDLFEFEHGEEAQRLNASGSERRDEQLELQGGDDDGS
jgi:hypothetical protein